MFPPKCGPLLVLCVVVIVVTEAFPSSTPKPPTASNDELHPVQLSPGPNGLKHTTTANQERHQAAIYPQGAKVASSGQKELHRFRRDLDDDDQEEEDEEKIEELSRLASALQRLNEYVDRNDALTQADEDEEQLGELPGTESLLVTDENGEPVATVLFDELNQPVVLNAATDPDVDEPNEQISVVAELPVSDDDGDGEEESTGASDVVVVERRGGRHLLPSMSYRNIYRPRYNHYYRRSVRSAPPSEALDREIDLLAASLGRK